MGVVLALVVVERTAGRELAVVGVRAKGGHALHAQSFEVEIAHPHDATTND